MFNVVGCRACSWAVGWVGRAEPALVAPRALALGADAARAVLAHLGNHPPALFHVRAAIVELFQVSNFIIQCQPLYFGLKLPTQF